MESSTANKLGIPAVIALAFLATLPGWLPNRVFISAATDAQIIRRTHVAADALRHGEAPLWDPTAGLGEPLLAQGKSGAFAPTILPHMYLKPQLAWAVSAAMHFAMAGLGMWMLARRQRLSGASRFLAAAIFMLAAMCIAQLNESAMNLAAWLPWVLLAVDRLAERVNWARAIVASLMFAAPFLLGDTEIVLGVIGASGCALLFRGVQSPKQTAIALPCIILSIVIGFALAGMQWVPIWALRTPLKYNGGEDWRLFSIIILALAIPPIACAERTLLIIRGRIVPSEHLIRGAWLLVPVLAVLSIATNRGIPLADFNALIIPRPHETMFATLPEVWIASTPQWFRTRNDLRAKMSDPSFDPATTVLLDDELPTDTREWIERALPDRHATEARGQRAYRIIPPAIDSFTQRGNRAVLRTKTGGTSWVVVAGTYADGWIASSRPVGKLVTLAASRDRIVLPAYGSLRVTPMMNEPLAAELVMEYRPPSFRRGLLVSGGAAVLLLLAGGMALNRKRLE